MGRCGRNCDHHRPSAPSRNDPDKARGHCDGLGFEGGLPEKVVGLLADRCRFAFGFPPCDHLACSGARWFKGKGLRAFSLAIDLVASAAEAFDRLGCPYMIENPVGTLATYWRKPDFIFDPWQFADLAGGDEHYTKKTCLWTGNGFVMPPGLSSPLVPPDSRIHRAPPGADRKNFRSRTPEGFSKAVFEANKGVLDCP